MLINQDTLLLGPCQSLEIERTEISEESTDVYMRNLTRRDSVICPVCGSRRIHVNGCFESILKGMPSEPGLPFLIHVPLHRYECQCCHHVFRDANELCYPHARVTQRLARWAKALLRFSSIKAVSEVTGVGWETLKRLHKEAVLERLSERDKKLKAENYRPRYLAVDEFAIHRGHSYATAVMDAETGEVLWVGTGRTIAAFRKFFESIDLSLLEKVEAVAMDMNASYNRVVEEYLPKAEIVYDRYHMEAQFGKEVMGAIRLETARKKLEASKTVEKDKKLSSELRAEYTVLKRSRWLLLGHKDDGNEELKRILEEYSDISTCFSFKEKMSELFRITDKDEARKQWLEWFKGAEESGIPQLVRFARLKRRRIEGLISHADHPIGTGRLEGTNNKIKVLKRIAYGYRDEEYFYALIRYLTIPDSHKNP